MLSYANTHLKINLGESSEYFCLGRHSTYDHRAQSFVTIRAAAASLRAGPFVELEQVGGRKLVA